MSQESLFDLGCEPVYRHARAADATRVPPKTCWDDCQCCSDEVHVDLGRKDWPRYRMCVIEVDAPRRAYEMDLVCSLFRMLRLQVPSEQPPAPPRAGWTKSGWEDY